MLNRRSQVISEERRDAWRDLLAGLVLLVVTALGTWSIRTNEQILRYDYGADPGPGLVPGLLLALLGLGASGLVLRAALRFVRTRNEAGGRLASAALRPFVLPAVMVALLIAYDRTLTVFGFVAVTAVFASLWSILIAWQEGRRRDAVGLGLFVFEGLAITAAMFLIFERIIGVPLP